MEKIQPAKLNLIAAAPVQSSRKKTRIEPTTGWVPLRLSELWQYRELLTFFVWRDVKVRYKQTIMGASWAIIDPFFTMVIFSLFFGRLAQVPSDGLPYPIFSYAGLVPWTFFAKSLTLASNSLVVNANMIKKIFFPRLTMPIAAVLAGLVDFVLAFIVLLGMMVYYGISPTVNVIWLPAFLLLAVITALGASLWLSTMNVQFRDVRYTIPFIIRVWMFSSPVVYSSSLLTGKWRPLFGLNPMVGVLEGFRWALLGTEAASMQMIAMSSVVAILLLFSGLLYFRRMEKTFADVV